MKIRGRYFARVWLSLLAVAIVALFIKLSIWQWHRYHFKQMMQHAYVAESQATPESLINVLAELQLHPTPVVAYKKIRVEGHYDAHQFLLDNRTHHGQVGFDVITPLHLSTGQAILVDRGFIPENSYRKIATNIMPPQALIELTGFLTEPSHSFVIGPIIEPETAKTWPRLVMRVAPKSLSGAVEYQLLPYLILLDAHESNGFIRDWSPPNLWAERSLGYCVQWLALALLVIIVYIIMSVKKNVSKKP